MIASAIEVVPGGPQGITLALEDGLLAQRIASSPSKSRAEEEELCRRFAPRVRLYGLKHLRNRDLADDLAQEVLLIAIESLREGRVREPHRIASFVLGTSRWLVQAIRNGDRRRNEILTRHEGEFPRYVAIDDVSLDRSRLYDCVAGLSARQRAIVVLTFYADRSADEIAAEIGTSRGNVRVIRHRALQQLHECMGGNTP